LQFPQIFNSFAAVPPRIMLRSSRETQRLDDLDRMPVAMSVAHRHEFAVSLASRCRRGRLTLAPAAGSKRPSKSSGFERYLGFSARKR